MEILQKLSLVKPCDSTGVYLTRIFQIYQHNIVKLGVFFKVSIRVTKPRCRIRRRRKTRSFLVRSVYLKKLRDTTTFRTPNNNNLILKKRLHIRSKVVYGFTSYTIKRKKLLKSFVRIM